LIISSKPDKVRNRNNETKLKRKDLLRTYKRKTKLKPAKYGDKLVKKRFIESI